MDTAIMSYLKAMLGFAGIAVTTALVVALVIAVLKLDIVVRYLLG
jgi:hypothetical protein